MVQIYKIKFYKFLFVNNKNAVIFASAFNATGALAQLVEQRTENPCVPGSIPGGTTINRKTHFTRVGFFMA